MITPARTDTRLSLGEVDPFQPVNYNSPLTRGLEGLWLPLPHLVGGSRLYDLSGHSLSATSSSGATSWTYDPAFPAPGVSYGGGYNHRVSPEARFFTSSHSVTIATIWRGDASSYEAVYGRGTGDSTYRLFLYANNSGEWDLWASDSPNILKSCVQGKLEVFTLVLNASTTNATLYANGGDNSVTASSYNLDSPSNYRDINVGARPSDSFQYTGDIYLVAEHSRLLSSSEIPGWHERIRRGLPNLLRRRDQSALYVSTAGAVTATATFTGEGTQQASGTKNADGTTALTGEGTQANTPEKALALSTSLTGSGQILSSVDKALAQTITLTGQGTQAATADKDLDVAIVITGGGTIANAYTTGTSLSSTATFTGAGKIESAVSADRTSVALLTGEGSIVAVGAKEVQDALRLTGEPTAQNVYESLKEAATSFDGQGTQQATGTKAADATSVLTGQGRISIQGTTAELGSAVDVVELTAIWDKDVDLVAVFDLTKDLDAQI